MNRSPSTLFHTAGEHQMPQTTQDSMNTGSNEAETNSESREEMLRRFSNSLRKVLELDPLPEDHDFSPEATDRRLMDLIPSSTSQGQQGELDQKSEESSMSVMLLTQGTFQKN